MTVAATPTLRGALAPVAALLVGTGLLYLGWGLQATLVPLRAEHEGFSRFAIGMLGSAYYAGFVIGCFTAPYVILRAGHIRAFTAYMAIVSAAALGFPLGIGEPMWLAYRFATGFCMASLLVIIESWLNDKSGSATRGAVMSTYIVITYVAISIGQLGVTVQPLTEFTLFSACSIILSLAAVPVALTRSTQPAPVPMVRIRPRLLLALAPAAFAGTFVSGMMTGSMSALGAVFAIDSGFRTAEAAFFTSAYVLGGALGQYPFGRASDFMDRRLVLLVALAGTVAMSLVLAAGGALPDVAIVAAGFAMGFVMLPVYSLAAAHAYDWTEHDDMVETSAGLLILFGLGSMVGPLLSSVLMSVLGPGGLFVTIAVAAAGLAVFVAVRLAWRGRPADAQRADFDIYSTATVGGAITPDPPAPVGAAVAGEPAMSVADAGRPDPAAIWGERPSVEATPHQAALTAMRRDTDMSGSG